MLVKSAFLWYTGYFLSGIRLQNVFVYVSVNFEIVDAICTLQWIPKHDEMMPLKIEVVVHKQLTHSLTHLLYLAYSFSFVYLLDKTPSAIFNRQHAYNVYFCHCLKNKRFGISVICRLPSPDTAYLILNAKVLAMQPNHFKCSTNYTTPKMLRNVY